MVNSRPIMKWYFAVFLLLQSFSAFHVNGYGEHDFVLQTTADGLISNPRPQLSCIVFGEPACQISCDIICDMYGCRSNGTCVDDVYCDCRELYSVSNIELTPAQYRGSPFNTLWEHRFGDSSASMKLLRTVRESKKITDLLRPELKNPRSIAKHLVLRLSALLPDSRDLRHLSPVKRGRIDDFVSSNRSFNYEKFRQYVELKIDNVTDETFDRLQSIQHKDSIGRILKRVKTQDDIKYVMRQLFLYPSNPIKVFANENRYNITRVLQHAESADSCAVAGNKWGWDIEACGDYVDELLLSAILEMFIEVISSYRD